MGVATRKADKVTDRIFTFEEYLDSVKEQVNEANKIYPQEDNYQFVDDNIDVVKERYEYDKERYENGEFSARAFNVGSTSSVANCLWYMFE